MMVSHDQQPGPPLYSSLTYEIAFAIDSRLRRQCLDRNLQPLREMFQQISVLKQALPMSNKAPFDYRLATYLDSQGAYVEGTSLKFNKTRDEKSVNAGVSPKELIEAIYQAVLGSMWITQWHQAIKPFVNRRCREVTEQFQTPAWTVMVDTLKQLGFSLDGRVKAVFLVTGAVNHAMKLPSNTVILDPCRDNLLMLRFLIHECLHPPTSQEILVDALLGLNLTGPVLSSFFTYQTRGQLTYPHIRAFLEESLVRAVEEALYRLSGIVVPCYRWNDQVFAPMVHVLSEKILTCGNVEEALTKAVREGAL